MKNRAQKESRMLRGTATQVYPSKKKCVCDGEVFFLDRGLLMGAIIDARVNFSFVAGYISTCR